MKWRFSLIYFVFFASFAFLAFHIYNLQIEQGSYYRAKAAQRNIPGFRDDSRGTIFFRDKFDNLIPVALTKEYPVVYAVPKEVVNPKATAKNLAPILDIDAERLAVMLGKPNDQYELLRAKVSAETVQSVQSLKLPGIYVREQNFRFYPFADLAAHLLGFVGAKSDEVGLKGRYGVELSYNDQLTKSDLEDRDLLLTVDRNVQTRAEDILSRLMTAYEATGGTVIVQEPITGKIVAMASAPTFDPNDYGSSPVGVFLNPAVQAVYEPGSIFKVLTMAAGLDSGKITPETTFVDSGSLTLNQKTIRNWDLKAHGKVVMSEIIEQSINTGAAFVERQIGQALFKKYLESFDITSLSGVELPGELSGSLRSLKPGASEINYATAAFGQGVALTPLRLTTLISAIANKGILMKPLINARESPAEVKRIFSETAALEVTKMMVSAVRKAHVADIPHYAIAGKTGTAQVPDFKKGGYSGDYIHSYAGFFPANNPRFTILVKLDKPKGATLAGATVVPAFKELADFLLNYYTIPPDDLAYEGTR